ncbi:MAG: MarR family transcriptional regulator [Bacteroidota bacterium]
MRKIIFENTILPSIGKLAKFTGFYFSDLFHENGIDLTKEQWLVLKKLHDKNGQVQNDLAFITNRSKTSLARLITTVEKKGYVSRIHSKIDKRINQIYLTESGKEIFKRSLPVMQNIINDLQDGITNDELSSTINVLNKIQKNLIKKHKTKQTNL